ncbi:hypothetical protein C8R44DRAFT_742398 [Mycena epipterygia]|nr:hypothetical protein C8R44DRAFT_742398 [Mycena epipterygia]
MSVIVDDRDAQVHYSPPTDWISGDMGRALEYNSTTISAEHAGSSAELTFDGTSITVYGTVDVGNGASMAFHVDQTPDTTLWTSDVLPQGTHTLFVTQKSSSTTNDAQRIQLDYFIYNTTATAGKTLFVDDSDARVEYSTGWGTMSGEPYFQNATHFTALPGSSFSFTFEGDSVSLNGPMAFSSSENSSNASIVIDGGSPLSLQQHHPILAGNLTLNSRIFETEGLSAGNHTVVVTLLDDQSPFYIDYFLVGSMANTAAPPAGITASAPAMPQPTSTSTPPSTSPNIGVIVAVVVGGLVVLAVLAFLLGRVVLFGKRRQPSIHLELPLERPPVGSPDSRWRQSTASSVMILAGDDDLPEAERKLPALYLNDG